MNGSAKRDLARPIGQLRPVDESAVVRIVECEEPLVTLSALCPRVHAQPQYWLRGVPGATSDVYVRSGVADRLMLAANLLPVAYDLLVLDG